MRGQIRCHLNPKHILVCPLFIFFLFLVWRSSTSVSPLRNPPSTASLSPQQSSKSQMDHDLDHQDCPPDPRTPACTKIPPSLSQSLIHYATSNVTPQQTINEVSVTEKVLRRKSPCNFLVFGLGHDSLMWTALNHGGRTLFVEEDKSWIDRIKLRFPNLESYHVACTVEDGHAGGTAGMKTSGVDGKGESGRGEIWGRGEVSRERDRERKRRREKDLGINFSVSFLPFRPLITTQFGNRIRREV